MSCLIRSVTFPNAVGGLWNRSAGGNFSPSADGWRASVRVHRRRDGREGPLPLSDKKVRWYLTAEAVVPCLTIVPWRSQAFWGLDVFELGCPWPRLFAARLAHLA